MTTEVSPANNSSSDGSRPDAPRGRAWYHPLVDFLHTEAAGGVLLLLCTAAALVVANSPLREAYAHFWHDTILTVGVGVPWLDLTKPLEWWVNDGLMTLFFFVVGLEIKRELVAGELRDPRKAALPAAAALGGMMVPAGIYLLLQGGQPGERGWGIPMATDIAFVVGVLALLPRVPAGLKILLLSLAIVDDLGAVLVIAVAYTSDLSGLALGLAGAGLLLAVGLRWAGVRSIWPYALLGVGVWRAVYASGIHPTIAGVALGLLTPAREWFGKAELERVAEKVLRRLRRDADGEDDLEGHGNQVAELMIVARGTMAPLQRLERALHGWVAFAIMPLFALANAGVVIDPALFGSAVGQAVALGLVLGKPIGVVLFSVVAVRVGVARLPSGVTPWVLVGGGCLAGIGFTMSLFITGLAFPPETAAGMNQAAKLGTLGGSVVSAGVGSVWLLAALRRRAA